MTKKIVVIQKGNDRYTFRTDVGDGEFNKDHVYYTITHEHLCVGGASVYTRLVWKDEGNELYKKLMAKGFKRFRNVREVSWYATTPNNTPYEEEWVVEGDYLVPVKSRVLD